MYDRLRRDLAYVKGLLEGEQQAITSERKALYRLIDVVDELVKAVEHLNTLQLEMEEYVEAIDDDLNDVELSIYDEELDEGIEIICPECGGEVLVDEEDLEDESLELLCPNCHTALFLEDVTDQELEIQEENPTSENL